MFPPAADLSKSMLFHMRATPATPHGICSQTATGHQNNFVSADSGRLC
jgi:hypothetical protein